MSRDEPRCEINLSLAVERIEQNGADRLLIVRKIGELFTGITRNAGGRHIEIACEIKCHCSM